MPDNVEIAYGATPPHAVLKDEQDIDAEIARAARAALAERLQDIASRLRLVVNDGVVEIAGDLESGAQKSIVDETIGNLAGVRSVDNRIRIMPPSRLAMRTLYR